MNAFVRQVKSLKELRLSNNNLEDFGGRRLAEALLENQSLKVCHVSNNKLSSDVADLFAEVIDTCPRPASFLPSRNCRSDVAAQLWL